MERFVGDQKTIKSTDYQAPVLRVLGSFHSLTQENGSKIHGKSDGFALFASPIHNTSP
jgi:hypothetical protein